MSKAIVIDAFGGPEVLQWRDVEVGDPGSDEVRIRHTAVGLNYIDVYCRTGLYPLLTPPATPGMEAAGVIEAVGPGVADFTEGDRVAYVQGPGGAYAEARTMKTDKLVKLPEDISDDQAAAMMLKGMTAEYLIHRTTHVQADDTVLVHAAAGGVGLLLCGWCKDKGARVIGTASNDAKARLAKAHGADEVIVTASENFVDRVAEITGGNGARYIYDGVGRDTFDGSLEALAMRGHLVSYGNASGPVEPFTMLKLSPRSATITRPTLFHYIAERAALDEVAGNLFDAVRRGAVKIEVNQTYPLAETAQAHRDLEARKTTGSTVLRP